MKIKLFAPLLILMLILSACGTSTGNGDKTDAPENTSENKKTESKNTNDNNSSEYPQLTNEVQENERLVVMETSMGTIKIKLFPQYAPKAVENFITHSKDGYYDGVTFHRVMNEFMIQGGDPLGNGQGGESIYGAPFEDEFSNKLYNLRGALSMANSGPNTNGSQFFIVQNSKMDDGLKEQMEEAGFPEEIIKAYVDGGAPWLDFKHTVFGQVIEGMDVVDKIASVETGEAYKPVKDVIIKKIKVLK
ncbi:peptidylprolyl isomerase [Cytobacillus depressus]|uniref:Peptidyl-prolyl cis-trans isomerase n=1 Tax=Cytobacillus depressus TaxID=1602942 RepID=A0A6L3V3U3_9BACI|nr:peptidylprolyl isomerase [Cytobacillus depressus]KAB2334706.1 peptidylprolyl isomerase [Cytobacillus depressus]